MIGRGAAFTRPRSARSPAPPDSRWPGSTTTWAARTSCSSWCSIARSTDSSPSSIEALAEARTPELRLLALIRTHLDFGFRQAAALKVINRDWELLSRPRRDEIAAKRHAYLARGLAVLRELDPQRRSGEELLSATNLLLGMLNGIATRPFLRSAENTRTLAAEIGALFLYGFLEATPRQVKRPA